jgi:hypothetical protein
MKQVDLDTRISILRNIGFEMWSKNTPQEYEDFWYEVMKRSDLICANTVIKFGFLSINIGREPEYDPKLGYYFIIGIGPFGEWEVLPPISKSPRSRPFSTPHAICLVDKPPETFTVKIKLTEAIETGIVRGEYFEPKDEIFRSYCTSA